MSSPAALLGHVSFSEDEQIGGLCIFWLIAGVIHAIFVDAVYRTHMNYQPDQGDSSTAMRKKFQRWLLQYAKIMMTFLALANSCVLLKIAFFMNDRKRDMISKQFFRLWDKSRVTPIFGYGIILVFFTLAIHVRYFEKSINEYFNVNARRHNIKNIVSAVQRMCRTASVMFITWIYFYGQYEKYAKVFVSDMILVLIMALVTLVYSNALFRTCNVIAWGFAYYDKANKPQSVNKS